MVDFLVVVGKISYVILIIGSILFGITIAVQVYVSSVIKKLLKDSRSNFDKIKNGDAKKECLDVINLAKTEVVLFMEQSKREKKLNRKAKDDSYVKIKQRCGKKKVELKDILLDLFKGTAGVFSNYGGQERGYLSFTEREIFSSINLLRKRLEEIIYYSNIIWLKSLKISTVIIALDIYKSINDLKGKFFVAVCLKIIDFFLWVGRVISPSSLTKYILKEFASDNLTDLFAKSLVEICGKELAYIYYEKSLVLKDSKGVQVA